MQKHEKIHETKEKKERGARSRFLGGLAGVLLGAGITFFGSGCAMNPAYSRNFSEERQSIYSSSNNDYDERRRKDESDLNIESAGHGMAAATKIWAPLANSQQSARFTLAAGNVAEAGAYLTQSERLKRWREEDRQKEIAEERRHQELINRIEASKAQETRERLNRYNQENRNQQIREAEEKRRETKKIPEFFTCNYWADNGDGYPQYDEIKGIKGRFKMGEKLRIVGSTGETGGQLKISMTLPNGKEYNPKPTYRKGHVFVGLKDDSDEFTQTLMKVGGVGNYKVRWYIAGNKIGEIEFEVYDPGRSQEQKPAVNPVPAPKTIPPERREYIEGHKAKVRQMESQYRITGNTDLFREIQDYKKLIARFEADK